MSTGHGRGMLRLDDESEGSADEAEPQMPGAKVAWDSMIQRNTNASSMVRHPFKCAVHGCTHGYTASGANATN